MRASGVLMPVSSIPSDYGIGCFSKEAYDFVDQLAEAGAEVLADPSAGGLPVTGIPRISPVLLSRGIHILSILKN